MATFVVTTLTDENDLGAIPNHPGGAGFSLREALALANLVSGTDTITFDPSLAGGTISLSFGELVIDSNVIISGDVDGDRKADITIDADYASRVFNVTSGMSTLGSLTITRGATLSGGAGGAIMTADGTHLTITDSTISNSFAELGGGIYSAAGLAMIDSTVSNNVARSDAGGIYVERGAATLTNVTITGNQGVGAIFIGSDGDTTLIQSTLSGNATYGAAISDVGDLTLVNSIVAGNSSDVIESSLGVVTYRGVNLVGIGADRDLADHVVNTPSLDALFASVATNVRGVTSGVLADNGGPVATVALTATATNPAIDAGIDSLAPSTDARGAARVDIAGVSHASGNITDLGAYEVQALSEPASLRVTTAADVVDAFDGLTSLREALAYANDNPGSDKITFAASLAGQTITLTGRELVIASDVIIDGDLNGDNRADITIDGNHASRVFDVTAGVATLDSLTITDGDSGIGGRFGGAVYVDAGARLTIAHSTVSNSHAGLGGGVANAGDLALVATTLVGNSASDGGGLYNAGTATLKDVTFAANLAGFGGGIENVAGGSVAVVNSTLTGNIAFADGGGGIKNLGQLSVTNSIVAGNLSDDIQSNPDVTYAGVNLIGAGADQSAAVHVVNAASLDTVFASVLVNAPGQFAGVLADNGGPVPTIALKASVGNPALDGGQDSLAPTTDARGQARADAAGVAHNGSNISDIGAYELQVEAPSLKVTTAADVVDQFDGVTSLREALAYAKIHAGADAITFDASLAGRTISLALGELVIASDVTIDGDLNGDNKADITIDAHGASRVFNVTAGSSTLDSLTIAGGEAGSNSGGAILVGGAATLAIAHATISDSHAYVGGGIASNGTFTLTDSTVSGNSASGSGSAANGGGLYLDGSATLTNVTLAENSARYGGGIFNDGEAAVTNATLSGNTATNGGGGIYNRGDTMLANSIAVGNENADVFNVWNMTYAGVNIISVGNLNGASNVIQISNLDALFASIGTNALGLTAGLLADNGGPVQTIALKASVTNPAIDGGLDSAAPLTDARGVVRADTAGAAHNGANISDIGAFEVQAEAQSLKVTTAEDVVDPFDGKTSLREALLYAASHAGADTITFEASLAGSTISLALGELTIASDVTVGGDIDGDHKADITIDAHGASRVFTVTAGTSTLDGLMMTGGDPGVATGFGGAIRTIGGTSLTVAHSTVSDSHAYMGGAISSLGALTLVDSTVSGNSAANAGGGVFAGGTTTLTNVTIADNSASYGGGIWTGDTAALTNVTIADNSASAGGGIYNAFTGVLAVTSATLSGNEASGQGGGIYNNNYLTLANSIVAGNADTSGVDLINASHVTYAGANVVGSLTDVGSSDGAVDHLIMSPSLNDLFAAVSTNALGVTGGVLADNGGLVQTIALKASATNPALDAAQDSLGPTTDARGQARFDFAGVAHNGTNMSDIGAYEVRPEAASLVVTTAADVADAYDNVTSLREALAYADSLAGADTIMFDASLAGSTISLALGELVIASDVTIDGDVVGNDNKADITVDAHGASRVFNVTAGTSTLDSLTITGGEAGPLGYGGGINVAGGTALTVAHSTVSNSHAYMGGAISSYGTLTLADSTISGNSATYGGGIFVNATAALTNVTVAGNSASMYGGGIATGFQSELAVTNATLSGNAASAGGGIINYNDLMLTNSIVAGNAAQNGADFLDTFPVGTAYSGVNIIGVGSDTDATDHVINTPGLGALFASGVLADNGGPVQTIAIKASGAAFNAGDNAVLPADAGDLDHDNNTSEALPFDARGFARIVDGTVDVGAYEIQDVTLTNTGLTITEGATGTIGTAALDFEDPGAAATAILYKITTAPANGMLFRDGSPVLAGGTFTQDDIDHNRISYRHYGGEDTSDAFVFSVSDPLGSTLSARTFALAITPVNDAPTLGGDPITVAEGGTVVVTTDALVANDPDNTDAELVFTVTGTSHGTVLLNGSATTSFTKDDLVNGRVAFEHDGGEADGSFSISLTDGSAPPLSTTVNVTVDPHVNDAPTLGGDSAITVDEGGTVAITTADLTATDPDNTGAQLVFTLLGASHGNVLLNGVVTTSFTQDDLVNGRVAFQHDGSEAGGVFRVLLSDGTAIGGAAIVTAAVNPVNDAPVIGGDLTITVGEGGSVVLTTADLSATDPDNTDAQLVFTVTGTSHGAVLLNGAAATSFTQDDLVNGRVAFQHDGGEADGSLTASLTDGIAAPVTAAVSVTVDPHVNDAPEIGGDLALMVAEGGAVALTAADLTAIDPDNADNELLYTVTATSHGAVLLSGAATTRFTQDDVVNGRVSFQHDGGELDGSFTVSLSDGSASGGSATVITMVDPHVNDDPVTSGDGRITVAEGGTVAITTTDLTAIDPDTPADQLVFEVNPRLGHVLLDGVVATTFTQADIVAGRVAYQHDGSEANDIIGLALGDGTNFRSLSFIEVTVDPHVDDAPVVDGQVKLASIGVNSGAHLITQADLLVNASDVDSASLTAVDLRIDKGQGALVDNHDGTWTYTAKINDDTEVTFSYQVSDGSAPSADVATLDIVPAQLAPAIGTPGNDTFTAVTGNSQYDGLGGIDTINFNFRFTEATVTYSGNQVIIDGPTSHTVLTGFEIYAFTDGTVNNNDSNPRVDDLFYYSRYHDVWNAHVDADTHYQASGWHEGRDPNAWFDAAGYLAHYQDVAAAGVNPLDHYHQFGWREGRDPSVSFDTAAYLAQNPDVAAAHVDPLQHFLQYGQFEGRVPVTDGVWG
jgi:hypothetical protein